MIDNTALLKTLFGQNVIRVKAGSFLDTNPNALPADFGRVEGMLLGLAIGDSLGNTTESRYPSIRYNQYGTLNDYLSNQYAGQKPKGVPSDDTQMAFWTLNQLIHDGGLNPDHLAGVSARNKSLGSDPPSKNLFKITRARSWHGRMPAQNRPGMAR